MSARCHFDTLVRCRRVVIPAELKSVPVLTCYREAEFTTVLILDDDGFEVALRAPLCSSHDSYAACMPGYEKSIRRRPATT